MSVRTFIGTVESLPSLLTVKVKIINLVMHPKYKKTIKKISHYLCHSTNSDIKVGQSVLIKESRPYSKRKTWEVVEIVNQNS